MTYPPEFPEDYKNGVETTITNAEQAFTGCEQGGRDIDTCVREYAITVFVAYCFAMCNAVQHSKMSAEKARKEMGHQLKTLIADVYYEKKGSASSKHIEEQHRQARQEMASDWVTIQAHLRNAIDHQERQKKDPGLGQQPQANNQASPQIPPRELYKQYRVRFPNEMVLDICWAADQHYSELKRWLRELHGVGSKPDRCFRALLTSGQSPCVYRPEPRPSKWK